MRVWDHHVEIWNDGELPSAITPENIEKVHASYPRNKNLAFAFYKAGFIESWGRGWQKICNGFEAAGLPKPTIESAQGGVLVTFQRNNVNRKTADGSTMDDKTMFQENNPKESIVEKDSESSQKITPKSGQKSGEWPEKWPENAPKILDVISSDKFTTIAKLEVELNLGHTTLKKILREMQNENIIRCVGPDKGGHWEIINPM